jgi:hypothetical protein
MGFPFQVNPTRSSQGFLPRLGAQGLLTLANCTLLNACSLLIGDIPGPIDSRDAADGGTPPSEDTGVNTVDDSAGGEADASLAPSAPVTDAAGPESNGTSGSSDSQGTDTTAPTDGQAFADASSTVGDTDVADAAGAEDTGRELCDRDEDGSESEACGGEDCDDNDPDVHPEQTRYFVTPNESVGFDYNCSGPIERDPSEPSLSCSLELAQCDPTAQGFMGETLPECGKQGDWGQCAQVQVVGLPGMCSAQKLETRRAGCH